MRGPARSNYDHFPSTEWTWLATRVMDAPRDPAIAAELRARVMARYAEPLRIYAKGSSLGWLDDAEALVNGFFASRLARDEYLLKWFESAMPLRRFLANGMLLYLREERRARLRRERRDGASIDAMYEQGADALAAPDDDRAFRELERAWARSVLGEACERARDELVAAGRGHAWAVFERHFIDGISYEDAARELGIRAESARPAARLAQAKVRDSMRWLLALEGVAERDMDEAIADVSRLVRGE
jgi:DNA-directed RNA polymerase specialized sigma24 family protein